MQWELGLLGIVIGVLGGHREGGGLDVALIVAILFLILYDHWYGPTINEWAFGELLAGIHFLICIQQILKVKMRFQFVNLILLRGGDGFDGVWMDGRVGVWVVGWLGG